MGNAAATVITSSPGFTAFSLCKCDVSEEKAIKFADEPELTVINFLTFKYYASLF